ncbi:DUF1330 domain-containing protein [Massilia dura]|uniref:DUF1330 domain-containing protein n=2 Tax=Pseudoduganella dura TaxID=321982 RepID=A0A6I3XI72_9BURK|nr:DUF1330 domain-containing protein [Pseudoduganella dura]GGX77170.1 hypothetical protein GCM10007386_05510 [Pseudoduganella dura]
MTHSVSLQPASRPAIYPASPDNYGPVETLEGPQVDGAVILQFPTAADARAAYDSPLYQEALQHRLKGAEYRVFIVEGVQTACRATAIAHRA